MPVHDSVVHDSVHLIADDLGGRPDIPANFILMRRGANQQRMRAIEASVRKLLADPHNAGNGVAYRVEPKYDLAIPHAPEIPSAVTTSEYLDGKSILPTPITILNQWPHTQIFYLRFL